MKKTLLILPFLVLGIFIANGKSPHKQAASTGGDVKKAEHFMQNQKAGFEQNKGQVTGEDASRVKYTFKDKGLSIFLLNNGLAYQFSKTHYPKGYKHLDKFAEHEELEKMEALQKDIRVETYRMDVTLVDANPNATITTEGKSQDYTQYYNHNALNVHNYSKITYHNVYPNIDWVIYSKGESVKYDFIVHPGGNPNQIKLQTNWVEDLKLNQDGSLTLQNRMGSITEQTPISFQGEKELKTNFNIINNHITFSVKDYSPTQILIIDPTLQWATYYGGNEDESGNSCTVDGSGNVYLSGSTGSTAFIASGGHQNTYGGGDYDAFLVKFNSAGVRQWATYYGGFGNSSGGPCAVDGSGNVYLAGTTSSTIDIASTGHQNTYGGGDYDAFLVKFNSAGLRQWATYYGGGGFDVGLSCTLDVFGNIYLLGTTTSTSSIAMGGHQNTFGGGNDDAFLVKFNNAGVRQWATYYGGSSNDWGTSCTVDGSDNVYLVGYTESTSEIAAGGHQNTYGGGFRDAFLVKFNSEGIQQWATYYGGSEIDYGFSCAVDGAGNVYLAGESSSTSDISFGGHQNTYGGGDRDAFLVKFSSAGVRQWATYYGESGGDYSYSCAADGAGNVYLAGRTNTTTNIASSGHQNTYGGGGFDAFLVKFGEHNTSSIFNIKEEDANILSIYPNPTQGNFTLTFGEDAARNIQVYDSFGKLIFQTQITQKIAQINLEGFANGIYHVKITEGTKQVVKSLVINN